MQPMPQPAKVITTPAAAPVIHDSTEIVEVPETAEPATTTEPPVKTVTTEPVDAETTSIQPAKQDQVVEAEAEKAVVPKSEPEPEPEPEKKLTAEPTAQQPNEAAPEISTEVSPPEKAEPVPASSVTQETSTEMQPGQIKPAPQTESRTYTATPAVQPLNCQTEPTRIIRSKQPAAEMETVVGADDAVLNDVTGIAELKGNVILERGDQVIHSDSLQYNSNTQDVNVAGNLHYERPGLSLQGQSASMNLDNETGEISQAVYRLPANSARGSADQLQMAGDGISIFKNASYTTCAPGNNDWILNAGEVQLDQNTGVGTAEDVKLYFKDTPIAYLPWATFPIDDRRKSGFLIPSVGNSDSTGFDVSIPYYFNLAPNYDATLVPRIMTNRGFLLGGEFRYLDEINQSIFKGEILPDDDDYKNNDTRGAASIEHFTQFNRRLHARLDLNYVSDDKYLEDLGDSLAVTSTKYLERTGSLTYNGDFFTLTGLVQEYQTIDSEISKADEPYKKLPQLTINGSREIAATNFVGGLFAQYTYFDHNSDSKAKGNRFDILPSVAYDWRRSWGYIKPKASVRYTSYDLDDHTTDSVDRTTSTFSLDSGLTFERQTSWFGQRSTQTLEPRLFYLYTPEENQNDIPLFDSDDFDFSYESMFRENRFTGADRVGDANQLTLAVTSRFLTEQASTEYLAVTLGQIFYFEDREVQLDYTDPDPGYNEDMSSFVAMVRGRPSTNWLMDAGIQLNPDFKDTEKSSLRVKYESPEGHLFSARYFMNDTTDESLEYTKFSAYWPVDFNTRLVGHSYYSLKEDRAIETVAGIEHGSSCCWRFRALAREYQNNADKDSNLSFLLQLELTGLAKLGDDIDSFLEDTIDGFARDN